MLIAAQVEALAKEITDYADLTDRVVEQARRRVLQGETVPTKDKIFSIFEPHTDARLDRLPWCRCGVRENQ